MNIETGKLGLGSSYPNITSVLYFRSELALVKTEDSRRREVLTGEVQEIDRFSCTINDDAGL